MEDLRNVCSVCNAVVEFDPVITCPDCFSSIGKRGASLVEELTSTRQSHSDTHDEMVHLAQQLDESATVIERMSVKEKKTEVEMSAMNASIDEYVEEIVSLKTALNKLESELVQQTKLQSEKKKQQQSHQGLVEKNVADAMGAELQAVDEFNKEEYFKKHRDELLQIAAENETLMQQRDDERHERLRVESLMAAMLKENRSKRLLDSPAPLAAPVSSDSEDIETVSTLQSAASLLEELKVDSPQNAEEEHELTAYRTFCQSCISAINEELQVTHPETRPVEYLEYYYRATRAVVPYYQVYTWIRATVLDDLGINNPPASGAKPQSTSRSLLDMLFSGRKKNKTPPVQGWLICRGGDYSWQQRWVTLSDRLDIASSDNPYSKVLASFALASIQEVSDASELRERAFRVRLSDGRVLFFATLTSDAFHLWINAMAKLC